MITEQKKTTLAFTMLIGMLILVAVLVVACAEQDAESLSDFEDIATDLPATAEAIMQETPQLEPELPPAAVLQAQTWLSDELGFDIDEVTIGEMSQQDWTDSCLGLGGPAESCAAVITPGWLITFEVDGQPYEVRTDLLGTVIRSPDVMMEGGAEGIGDVLANTAWQLVSYGLAEDPRPVVLDSTLTLEFAPDAHISGEAGCNAFGTTYTIDGTTLVLDDIASTDMACEDDAVNAQEQEFLNALATVTEFEITEDGLKIWYDGGLNVLNFVRLS